VKEYQMSEQCERIHKFVSHSWHSPWWQRYLALLIHFYWKWALVAGVCTALVLFALDMVDMLPTGRIEADGRIHLHALEMSFWGLLPPL